MGKKKRVNKYIPARLQVAEEKNKEKNHMVGIHYELFDIYILHIEEVDMSKKSNVNLICRSVKLESKF